MPACGQVEGGWSGYWCQGRTAAQIELTLRRTAASSESTPGQGSEALEQIEFEGELSIAPLPGVAAVPALSSTNYKVDGVLTPESGAFVLRGGGSGLGRVSLLMTRAGELIGAAGGQPMALWKDGAGRRLETMARAVQPVNVLLREQQVRTQRDVEGQQQWVQKIAEIGKAEREEMQALIAEAQQNPPTDVAAQQQLKLRLAGVSQKYLAQRIALQYGLGRDAVSLEQIDGWIAAVTQDRPQALRRSGYAQVTDFAHARLMLGDPSFARAFGSSVKDLDLESRQDLVIVLQFLKAPPSLEHAGDANAQRAWLSIRSSLHRALSLEFPLAVAHLEAAAAVRDYADRQADRLASLDDSPRAAARLQEMERVANQHFVWLWPQEQAAFREVIQATRERLGLAPGPAGTRPIDRVQPETPRRSRRY